MAEAQRVTWIMRLANRFTSTLLRVGVKLGDMTLLTVRGRKSGLPRTTPVTVVEHNDQRYLVGTFGGSQWVRNLRAAGKAVLTCGRHSEAVSAAELPPAEAALILRFSLSRAPDFVRQHFNATAASPIEDLEREAMCHPVFLLQSKADRALQFGS